MISFLACRLIAIWFMCIVYNQAGDLDCLWEYREMLNKLSNRTSCLTDELRALRAGCLSINIYRSVIDRWNKVVYRAAGLVWSSSRLLTFARHSLLIEASKSDRPHPSDPQQVSVIQSSWRANSFLSSVDPEQQKKRCIQQEFDK